MSLHVECGQAGGQFGGGAGNLALPVEIAGTLAWTETIASGGTTAVGVPASTGGFSLTPTLSVLTLTASADGWVSIGPSPAPGSNPRIRMLANTTRWFAATSGQKVGWLEG